MKYMLQFFPEVEDDVVSGYNWFEDKAPGLGEEFIRLFYACAGGIQRNPMLHPVVFCEFRRCLLRRFPYAAYYRVEKRKVIIFGLFHCARDISAIEKKMRRRNHSF